MATVKDSIPHIIRTAEDPRQKGVWTARLSNIDQINSKIRLLRLSLPRDGPPLRHLPGQYIDLYIPDIDVVGGFTITSPPQASSQNQEDPHIELAIQDSPSNPPAAYLWQPIPKILDSTVTFRVGGNFVYPPPTLNREECEKINRVVFVAGGVGINPIMSMISAMHEIGAKKSGGMVENVRVLYTSRREKNAETGQEEEILFEKRLNAIAEKWKDHKQVDYRYSLFMTSETSARKPQDAGTDQSKRSRLVPPLNDAPSYLDNIKVRFTQQPEVYEQFLEILKAYKREEPAPIHWQDMYAQITQLFRSAPDLVEGFRHIYSEPEACGGTRYRRINHDNLFKAVGPESSRGNTVVYVCGLPAMTDEFVALVQKAPGMEEKRVLCEKWW